MGSESNYSGSLYYAGLLFSLPLAVVTYNSLGVVIETANPYGFLLTAIFGLLLAATTIVSMLGATGLDK